MNDDKGQFLCDDPYERPINLPERWGSAISATESGLPIQCRSYNNYGGHHYWGDWFGLNQEGDNQKIDWEYEFRNQDCKFLTRDYRPTP